MMGQLWKTHIIILIAVHFPELVLCSPLDEADSASYPVNYVYSDDGILEPLEKRLSSFVRIGRGLSSFIRIGRNDPNYGEYESGSADDDVDMGEFQKRKSAFVRIGRGDEPQADKRLSSFVRIGKSGDETEPYFTPFEKRGGAFIRLGKFPSAAFVRNRSGKIHSIASPPYYRRSGRIGHSSFIRIGKRDTQDALKQATENGFDDGPAEDYMNFNRNIQNVDSLTGSLDNLRNEQQKRMSSFVRIGRPANAYTGDDLYGTLEDNQAWPAAAAKRMSKFVRIGKNTDADDIYKRMSSFVRIGKSHGTQDDLKKRMSSFVRIGKNSNDNDKRMSKFVRIGKALEVPNDNFNAEKRRLSKFVRIGKDSAKQNDSDDRTEQQPEKRISSFVRIGKSDNDKRISSFVRIGRLGDTNSADAIQTYLNEDLDKDELNIKAE